MLIKDLETLDLTVVVKEIKEFVLENYKCPVYEGRVLVCAFHKWVSMFSEEMYANFHNNSIFFNNQIYPLLKHEMAIVEGENPFHDTLII